MRFSSFFCTTIYLLCTTAAAQDACPLPSNTTQCTSISRNPSRHLKCGVPGKIRHPHTLGDPCVSPSLEACRDSCVLNATCASFSFDPTQIMSGICTLYKGSLVSQGFHVNNNSVVKYWNSHCYRKSCSNLGCPSSSFQLHVTSGTSQYTGTYIHHTAPNALFTPTHSNATSFALDADCHLSLAANTSIIANDFNANMSLPDPLYFIDSSIVAAQGFAAPTCSLSSRREPKLACVYAGVPDGGFFACNGALSLPGPYPGDGVCGMGNGSVTLKAVNFGE